MFFVPFAIIIVAAVNAEDLIFLTNGEAQLIIANDNDELSLSLIYDNPNRGPVTKLSAVLGVGLDKSNIGRCVGLDNCLTVDDHVRLHVTESRTNSFEIAWSSSNTSKVFTDCFDLSIAHWYGGPEWRNQAWPVEKLEISDFAYVIKNDHQAAVAEPYWLNSLGAYIFVDYRVPLFIDQNQMRSNSLCYIARSAYPYSSIRTQVKLSYTVVADENPRTAHLNAVNRFLGKPTGHPNPLMVTRPIFSTWARYYRDINDEVVNAFAQEIIHNDYQNSQIEIDDKWEYCYGSLTFDTAKFANITETIQNLHDRNFRVAFWTHPFVNEDCDYTEIGRANDFFVKDKDGNDATTWWNTDTSRGETAHSIDFTNPEARQWFVDRLQALKDKHGMDSFKFDAGETDWYPDNPVMSGDPELQPSLITAEYVRTVAALGDLIEVRSAWGTQDLPVFVRMIDKDSHWGVDNGLYTLVTTLLQMNMNGYTMVLPDMVGGNGYDGRPDDELFIRWLQANTFMPAIQFSFVPWDFSEDVQRNALNHIRIHDVVGEVILEAMDQSILNGTPVNPPIWWVDPENPDALACDTEFLIGDGSILVAPVLEQGATSRDVILPEGQWIDPTDLRLYEGRQILQDYPAPLSRIPYFISAAASRRFKQLLG